MRSVGLLLLVVLSACGVAENNPNRTSRPPAAGPVVSSCDWHTGKGCPAVPTGCHEGVNADERCTPGARNAAVTQATIGTTICVRGYTKTVRPPLSYTAPLKRASMKGYGATGSTKGYEFDHRIALEDGGAAADIRNLWPEAYASARKKDRVEDRVHADVCSGKITLAEGQRQVLDWTHP